MRPYRVVRSEPGIIKLADGSVLVLRVAIVGVKPFGFSPFDNIGFLVKTVGGTMLLYVPEELRKRVAGKPVVATPGVLPREGWESIDIVEQSRASEEVEVEVEGRHYRVRAVAEASMVSRNTNFRVGEGEPLYAVQWFASISWRLVREGERE